MYMCVCLCVCPCVCVCVKDLQQNVSRQNQMLEQQLEQMQETLAEAVDLVQDTTNITYVSMHTHNTQRHTGVIRDIYPLCVRCMYKPPKLFK